MFQKWRDRRAKRKRQRESLRKAWATLENFERKYGVGPDHER